MEIGHLVDSNIMQILPFDFALKLVQVMREMMFPSSSAPAPVQVQAPASAPPPQQQMQQPQQQMQQPMPQQMPQQDMYGQQQYAQPMPQQQYYMPMPQQQAPPPQQYQNVQAAQFQSFDVGAVMQQKENIDIIMDVPLEVTVELGRTSKKIKEILEFSPTTIIELDKLAGEPIDILVNGKFVAKGEVVVIDENFGIRITDIISPEHRI
jgi:flagellar motor switch protein FliN/FliY